MNKTLKLVVSVAFCETVGILSTPFTLASITGWYQTLHKPIFSPPNWVFGPVWTLLYLLMGISLYLVWKQGWKKQKIKIAMKFFLAQIACNFFWSIFFFGLKSPIVGLIDITLLWIAIIITMKQFYPLSKAAFYLLLPYILWVSFALLLNFSIVVLN